MVIDWQQLNLLIHLFIVEQVSLFDPNRSSLRAELYKPAYVASMDVVTKKDGKIYIGEFW